ncbi:MAG: multicopper oxidase domain-containing protein [Acidimicrobiia bacterium]|nr:multicopper oxidase domain-containing protein [Acidimicrobiia bacterium]
MSDGGVSRRDLLKSAGLGGAALIGGTVLGRSFAERADAATGDEYDPQRPEHDASHRSAYGATHGPPMGIGADALDYATFPPPPDGRPAGTVRDLEFTVTERLIEVADGAHFEAWTYNGTVPGPTIRATEGDQVRIRFVNGTGRSHNLHFHGAHRPEHDGWEPIPPGSETIYEIEAGPAGVHPYHCHTAPLAEHVSRGLYGTMIVDPPGGRSPAHEVSLLLSGFSNAMLGRNGVVAWNGLAGFYHDFPIKVPVGEPVRAYITNMLEYEPVGSFHLHAETFDVYPAGMGDSPAFREDTIALAMGQRAMIEFTLPHLGRYMFHPHQHWLADRGAMGWFAAV